MNKIPYYAVQSNSRNICATGWFDSLNHAIAFYNSYFNDSKYEIYMMVPAVFKQLYENTAINISVLAEDFYNNTFDTNKQYNPPIGSIIGTKMYVGTKRSKNSKV